MAIHTQTHSAIGADHAVIGGSAYYFLGINTSGTPLEWQVLQAGSMMYVVYAGSAVTIHNNPGDEELVFFASTGVWTNMPAAKTEFLSNVVSYRTQFDLTFITSCRTIANLQTAGTANSHLFAEVSTDGGTTWINLGATGTTSPAVSTFSATVVNSSPWVAIRAGYRRDVVLRMVGTSGDGVVDPVFGHVGLQLR